LEIIVRHQRRHLLQAQRVRDGWTSRASWVVRASLCGHPDTRWASFLV